MTDEFAEENPLVQPPTYPEGDYAIVEVMGHVRHVGRVTEVDRFGTKFCQVEPVQDEQMGPPVLVGGASIYQFTGCTAEYAYQSTMTYSYRLKKEGRATPQLTYSGSYDDEDGLDHIPF